MTTSILAGILRAVVPAIIGYAAGKGIDLNWLVTPEVTAAIATIGAAIWSVAAKKKAKETTL